MMALAVAGSPRFGLIARGAYPHFGVLQRWQLTWPWLVGVVDKQALPGPVDWKLWVGNLQSGHHVVIDRGNNSSAGRTGWMRAFPDFELAGGRVVWTRMAYRQVQAVQRIAMYDLALHRTVTLAIPQPGSREMYANPTLSGSRVVWERY